MKSWSIPSLLPWSSHPWKSSYYWKPTLYASAPAVSVIFFNSSDMNGMTGKAGDRYMGRTTAIETFGLCKTYDGATAVDNLSFQVYSGEIFGLLGPNGAGKSTTLRMLMTLLRPTGGRATVMGHD